jgi:hypothetical protein
MLRHNVTHWTVREEVIFIILFVDLPLPIKRCDDDDENADHQHGASNNRKKLFDGTLFCPSPKCRNPNC